MEERGLKHQTLYVPWGQKREIPVTISGIIDLTKSKLQSWIQVF